VTKEKGRDATVATFLDLSRHHRQSIRGLQIQCAENDRRSSKLPPILEYVFADGTVHKLLHW
jgi:hypothetical protein